MAEFISQLDDSERTAFGLGYEYRRRGRPLDDNPFPLGHWKNEMFFDGWKARKHWEQHPMGKKGT